MSADPLVSILIPCWGCRDFIRAAIESAVVQSYSNWEVIVVENCGDDGTYEEALKVHHPRLRVIRNDRNYGMYGNKNRAMELAAGDLLKYLDGDDLLEPTCVERLVDAWRAAGEDRAGIVFGNFTWIGESGEPAGRPSAWGFTGRLPGMAVLGEVLRQRQAGSRFGNPTPHLFYRPALRAVGGFPDDNAGPGDLETFLKLLCTTDAYFLDERVARYRIRRGSMVSVLFGLRESIDCLKMVEKLEAFFQGRTGLPAILKDGQFLREWRVWSSAYNIFANYRLMRRGRQNQFDEIRAMYENAGLAAEFRTIMTRDYRRYIYKTLRGKVRRKLGLPQEPPLFGRRFLRGAAIA